MASRCRQRLHLTEPSSRRYSAGPIGDAIPAFDKFLAAFRKKKLSRSKALQTCLDLIKREPCDLIELLEALPAAWADHAVASVYATLIPADRRKRLGAYFTPPHLVDHLVSRLAFLWDGSSGAPPTRSCCGRCGLSCAACAHQGVGLEKAGT